MSSMTSSSTSQAAPIGDDRHFRVDSDVRALAVSEHNVWLAHHDGDVTIRKTRTTELVHTIRPSPGGGRAWSMVVVPYGQNANNLQNTAANNASKNDEVWLGLSNGTIDVYDAVTYEKLHSLLRHTGGIYTLAEYGGYVYSGSNDFTIVMWSAERHRSVRQLCGHSSYVRCLYAEGSIVISGGDDHTIRVWEVPSGKLLQAQHFHHSGVSTLARVGMHMWSGDDLGQICVWALGTYELLVKNEKAHASRITIIKKVGSRVYIGSTDRKVSIWDAYGKKQLRTMEDHNSWITCVACPSVLSRYFVWSAGADGAVRCWHHDEYKIMSGDAERFDDVRWYYTMHPPGQEQTTALLDQIHHQDHQLVQWKQEADTFRGEASRSTQQSETLNRRLADALEECVKQKARADSVEALLSTKTALLLTKETELESLSSKTVGSVTEIGALKVQVEGLIAKLKEEERRADQAVAEKLAADSLLIKLKDLKAEEAAGGRLSNGSTSAKYLPLLILNTPSDVGSTVIALHHDIRSLLQLNEALRDEVERYKGVLGIKTNTPYPILKLASLAEDRVRDDVPLYVVPPLPLGATNATGATSAGSPSPSIPPQLKSPTIVPTGTAPTTTTTTTNSSAATPAAAVPPKPSTPSPTASAAAAPSSASSITSSAAVGAVDPISGLPKIPSLVTPAAAPTASTTATTRTSSPPLSAAPSSDPVPAQAKPLVPAPPASAPPHAASSAVSQGRPIVIQQQVAYGAFATYSPAGTQSHVVVSPSQPLFTIDAHRAAAAASSGHHHHGGGVVAGNTFEELHGGAQWLKSNVAEYVQERYHRKVTPLFGPPVVTTNHHHIAEGGTPRRDVSPRLVSPRSHGRSSVRPATAAGFGSSTTRKYF
ncbi:WD40 repeat-containing protein, putative [Bodo saltans]|uniref:WD40 repeat-containing protein, putative n=1 Tax=Bodo saltans TaxID=75058 RepID=A0A0S4JA89_BODSA|nr:WD40 repeat-containing protein, putative [Bodo saltans]|eukprot:CUG87147.1 WD40 repeat-containing protein, putative [Bodo saltans]